MATKLTAATGAVVVRRGPGRPSNAERALRAEEQHKRAQGNAGRQGHPAPDPTSNVTDETILEYLELASPLYDEVIAQRELFQRAQNRFKALLKKAGQNGVIEIEWLLKARRQDIHELDRKIAMRNRLAVLGRLPIGTQLGFLPGQATTVASAVDTAQLQAAMNGPEPKPEPEEPHEQPEEPDENGEPMTVPAPAPIEEPPPQAAEATPVTPAPAPATPAPAPATPAPAPATPAPAPATNGQFANIEEAKAYNQGGRARMFGRAVEANVYLPGSPMAQHWERGWRDKDSTMAAR